MKLKTKYVAALVLFIFAAMIPWIWLSNEYGLSNIPHYDIQMWIFMELYALICLVIFAMILLVMSGDGDEEPPKKKRSSAAQKKPRKNHKKEKKEEKPRKSRKTTSKKKEEDYPPEWDERKFD